MRVGANLRLVWRLANVRLGWGVVDTDDFGAGYDKMY